jgi:CBS domain containing-hemolysin-like protein
VDVDTVAGLIYETLGRVPQQGETLTVAGTELRVERTHGQRITKVRVTLPAPVPKEEPATP